MDYDYNDMPPRERIDDEMRRRIFAAEEAVGDGVASHSASCDLRQNRRTQCSCHVDVTDEIHFKAPKLRDVPLAMVYSPYQEWDKLYDEEIGFEHGTVFKDLDFPFYPTPCGNSRGCRGRNVR